VSKTEPGVTGREGIGDGADVIAVSSGAETIGSAQLTLRSIASGELRVQEPGRERVIGTFSAHAPGTIEGGSLAGVLVRSALGSTVW